MFQIYHLTITQHLSELISWTGWLSQMQYSNLLFINARFLGGNDQTNFFTRAQRSRMVFEILSTTVFGREKKGEVGIDRLIEEGGFGACFPLHDVTCFISSIQVFNNNE